MATTVVPVPPTRLRADRVFFPVLSVMILAIVFAGFGNTYYLRGMQAPSPLIHVHGAAFALWMLLLIVQTALVGARKMRVHRTLGLAGFGLAVAMIVLGVLAATDSLRRGFAPPHSGLPAETFYAIPWANMLLFSTLVYFSYRLRFKPAEHKRLIMLATVSLLDAAMARIPLEVLHSQNAQLAFYIAPLLLLIGYDLVLFRKVTRPTWMGSLWIVAVHLLAVPVGSTAAWHGFAGMMAKLPV